MNYIRLFRLVIKSSVRRYSLRTDHVYRTDEFAAAYTIITITEEDII